MKPVQPVISQYFPELSRLEDSYARTALDQASIITLPENATAFQIGASCENYLLVIEGTVRVQQTAANGREIILYRVHPGESCVLTTSCLMARNHYPAEGITETEVKALMIPAKAFQQALEHSPGFRQLVLNGYALRLADLMSVIENIAFRKLDCRLSEKLLELAGNQESISVTHQDLAIELGSAREVISRLLKDLERKGWISLSRGTITLNNRDELTQLAECD